jgi:hypothetical protein
MFYFITYFSCKQEGTGIVASVAESRILILSIPGPTTATKEKAEKKFFLPLVVATKLKIILFLNWLRKRIQPIYK